MNYEPTMLDIGQSKQIFVDDLVIESVENVCRTWHQPTRVENPVIIRDRPWEQITYFTFNGSRVVRDPEDGIFKCVYQIWNRGDTPHDPPAFHLLYAESEDGVHWRKPELDVFRHDGANTNIVIPNAYGMTYVLDPHEEDPARRFKAIYLSYLPKKLFESSWKVIAATSGDLVHWTDLPERPQVGRAGSKMDDSNALSYDPFGRIFILNMRHYDMYAIARNLDNPELEEWSICPPYYPLDWRRINKRRIWQTESADMIHWSEPYAALTPEDGEDDLDETYYGFYPFPAGGVQMGFLNTMSYVLERDAGPARLQPERKDLAPLEQTPALPYASRQRPLGRLHGHHHPQPDPGWRRAFHLFTGGPPIITTGGFRAPGRGWTCPR